ncbi:MAG TPA: hypothetical protein VI146_05435 [Nitrososphaeraceae archaeon]
MENKHKIEGELLEKLKAHLIHKLLTKEKSLDSHRPFDCEDAIEIINSFDGVPTPPDSPPGGGTK